MPYKTIQHFSDSYFWVTSGITHATQNMRNDRPINVPSFLVPPRYANGKPSQKSQNEVFIRGVRYFFPHGIGLGLSTGFVLITIPSLFYSLYFLTADA
jgi:hypothetical protein